MFSEGTEKIFVDPNEEISFVIERVLKSKKSTAIVVVPKNSMLFASVLSLKILFRQAVKSDRSVIVVTEDKYGINIAQKAGFVVVQKVSQITSDLIEVAMAKVLSAKAKMNQRRQDLLPATDVKQAKAEIAPTEETVDSLELSIEESELEKVEETEDSKSINDKLEEEYEKLLEDNKAKAPEAIKEIGGIKIFSGSDAADFTNEASNDKMQELNSEDMNENSEVKERNIDTSVFGEKRFAGRDLTRQVKSNPGNFFSKLFNFGNSPRNPDDRLDGGIQVSKMPIYKRRWFMISAAVTAVILLLLFLIVFQWSQVTVIVELDKQEVLGSETVEISLDTNRPDIDNLLIPGIELTAEESMSSSATANGEGERGNRATGFVYIFNKTESAITLPAGTKLRANNSQLDYVLVEATNLPAATRSDDGSLNASLTEGIQAQALTFGEEYNISGGSNNQFAVEGFNNSQLEARREGNFTGGTKETFRSVSEANLNDLKKKLLDDLKPRALERLDRTVPEGSRLIEESVVFEEKEVKATPEVDEPARTDGTFDLSIVLVAKGIVVREQDLADVLQEVLSKQDNSSQSGEDEDADSEIEKSIDSLDSIEIARYTRNGDKIQITIEAEGVLTNVVDEDNIKNLIAGKGMEEADEALKEVQEISRFQINFNPDFVPGWLRRVPGDKGRITVRFR